MAVVIPYTKQTWTDGVSSCSAARNNVHEDGINDAHYQPCVQVSHNATQATTHAVYLTAACNTEIYDTAGNVASTMHDNVTNNSRLTCRHAGIYVIYAGNMIWAGNPVVGSTRFFLNAATTFGEQSITADYRAMCNTAIRQLAVNDFVELQVRQNSGGGMNLNASLSSRWPDSARWRPPEPS